MTVAADNKVARGKQAEDTACRYLIENGLKLIEKNYKCRSGEIDLVMQHNDSIVFVEVRYRHNNRFGSGAESVIKRKQEKIILTALHYLQSHRKSAASASRFDVISIQADCGKTDIQWIQNAFQA
jgi:putative endonuclease